MQLIIGMIIAYLLGSISSAILVCKLAKIEDPRQQGSKSAGATNVLRVAGKKAALYTLAGDLLKGLVAVLIGRLLGLSGAELGFIALAAVLGHIFPVFFKFKGGKGVATSLGSLLALSPLLALCALAIWLLIAVIFRYSSLSALVAAAITPILTLFIFNPNYFLPLTLITLLVFWKHIANIKRLLNGTETKIGQKQQQE